MFAPIRYTKCCVIRVVGDGTACSETATASKELSDKMISMFQTICIYRHGTPLQFSASTEFAREAMSSFISLQNILVRERSVGKHNKTGIEKRKNHTVKMILERLQLNFFSESDALLLSRVTLFSNLFSGSRLLSSFKQFCGYSPSILGRQSTLITRDLHDPYLHQAHFRAMNRLLKACNYRTVTSDCLQPEFDVICFLKHQNPTGKSNGNQELSFQ